MSKAREAAAPGRAMTDGRSSASSTRASRHSTRLRWKNLAGAQAKGREGGSTRWVLAADLNLPTKAGRQTVEAR
jgi:hypothetical protein